MHAWDMSRLTVANFGTMCAASTICAGSPQYFVYVSNERSGDVTVIDGTTEAVVATFGVGERPRGIHAAPDGRRLL
jgi:YVTN family beta-propeller protein